MRILIAGAGIAGSCAATVLREAGHEVVVADPAAHRAASRCAFAVTRLAWWDTGQRTTVRRSLDWYGERGRVVTDRAMVYDVRRGRKSVQFDHYLVDPVTTLVKPDVAATVGWWEQRKGSVLVDFRNWIREPYDALVIAAGPATAPLIGKPSTGISYGGVFLALGNRLEHAGQLSMLRRTDRLSYTAAYVNHQTRIGASRCSSPEQAHRIADGIRDRMLSEGVVCGSVDDWHYRSGTRYATDAPGASRIAERVWALTGLARSGFALAPAAALDIAIEIGELK